MDRARLILAGLGMHDVGALDTSAQAVVRTGSRLVTALAAAVTTVMPKMDHVHRQLSHAWKLDEEAAHIVRRCLVLTADHELNASTYVARCIASTGASPYAALLGALGALSGPKHGGETSNVEVLLREALGSGDIQNAVAGRLQRGERIPGFGHPLYPDGDPRAAHILDAVRASRYNRQSGAALHVAHKIFDLIGRRPNVDFALGLVSVVLKLPPGSGLGMFLVGRSVGWIAHVIEQYSSGSIIRPRARYVGILPA
jgi:citrate synthase